MATKKAKPKARKSAAKKPRAKQPPVTRVQTPFEPSSEVRFYPRHTVEVEKGMSREPIPEPARSGKVGKDGVVSVRLGAGLWTAVAQVGGQWRYFDFSVKA